MHDSMMMGTERQVRVQWVGHGKVFEGRTGNAKPVLLDGDSEVGPSPTEALLMSLASCMAIDINVILEKSRVLVEELMVDVLGVRATEQPHRFTSLRILITVEGPSERDQSKLERAAQLSHDKYCSVFHTLRPDLEVEVSAVRA